jgi:hypothetical protein
VTGSKSCDTRERKGEQRGKTNLDLPQRASLRLYYKTMYYKRVFTYKMR